MLRFLSKTRPFSPLFLRNTSLRLSHNQIPIQPQTNLNNPHHIPPPAILPNPNPLLSHPNSPKSSLTLTLTLTLTSIAALLFSSSDQFKEKSNTLYTSLEQSLSKSNESIHKIIDRIKQTGVAAAVLWKSLRSVLSSANHEVRLGFELRVASLLADIVAANAGRRSAIVGAGGGAVVDWLLDSVASSADPCGTQAESARALAYLIADPNVCEAVLGRPHAVPNLLRFIFSFQPQRAKKKIKRTSFDGVDIWKGRSMLVAAIMDIITSNCDSIDRVSFQPTLPGDADMGDIAAALQVVEDGGMHLDEPEGNDDEDGDKGMRGIGIKILGGTTVLGFSRTNGLLKLERSDTNQLDSLKPIPSTLALQKRHISSSREGSLASVTVPGLWDDLRSQHVAVPFAAWALANWAMASDLNRSHIQELDRDGHAVMTALIAPERTVKWHGSLVAQLLLEDHNLPLTDSVPDWSSSLLSTVSQASKADDIPLVQLALSAFLVSLQRSVDAQALVMEKGLYLMRQIAKQTEKHRDVQETLAKALELLSTGDTQLSLEESQRWSGILLPWVCGKFSTDATRISASKILSCVLEDYGPASILISQGWLTLLLTEILSFIKTESSKGNSLKTDKVKTQIDQSNVLLAAQIVNQLASAVVNLAGGQLETTTDYVDRFPLADLLSLKPFSELFKNFTKGSLPKFDAADSAMATLKGIKALTEICAEDSTLQNKIADFGVLCLLRRFLLRDDYEQLAAIEAYDASRVRETQDRVSNVSGETSAVDSNDPSSVRVPPTAHIRKHAARLLTILSLLPKVQKAIINDEIWCKWLEDCASGKIPGCNDLKLQSYARATLLNIFCAQRLEENATDGNNSHDTDARYRESSCPRYDDMIFLINPELPHWNCFGNNGSDTPLENIQRPKKSNGHKNSSPYDDDYTESETREVSNGSDTSDVSGSENCSESAVPLLDIVFIHGLRGGPFKTWRIADNKSSTTSKSGLVEKIDQEAGKQGTCWPREWLAFDFPHARLFTVKYKTNLTQWSGASLPLQEVSSMLLKKLVAAGIGNRPVVFVTHSMGGLVVKQMLHQAKTDNFDELFNNTRGIVFYSCPHFGSKLADMPWRMGLVFRPAPSIGELRSGSPRLVELNDFVRHLHNKRLLEVLSFSETMVTPIVEGYGGWAFRAEIVPIESAYPGFGELVVLDATDHINSCKPVSHTDPSYTETLAFLQKLKAHYT
ncbi:alpha/beta-Hydrolases superfamily protein isoform X2 [Tasmannia lanceolata]|uniref:alpha/beta-Hydrolases superfamily protein isoform X1 n=1 Tax=Tasmannia lanceolata TaxID=3420 RepID=UPI00406469F4